MNYGFLDIEMTCDGRIEGGRFVGTMKVSEREIISVGFVVCDENYRIKERYYSFVKPLRNATITEYCEKLTGITQSDVDHGKKCSNAFRDIKHMCDKYSVSKIRCFGNSDKAVILRSARRIAKSKENASDLLYISNRITNAIPAILKEIGFKKTQRQPGLKKIAEVLGIETGERHHDAMCDAILLCKVCKILWI